MRHFDQFRLRRRLRTRASGAEVEAERATVGCVCCVGGFSTRLRCSKGLMGLAITSLTPASRIARITQLPRPLPLAPSSLSSFK